MVKNSEKYFRLVCARQVLLHKKEMYFFSSPITTNKSFILLLLIASLDELIRRNATGPLLGHVVQIG